MSLKDIAARVPAEEDAPADHADDAPADPVEDTAADLVDGDSSADPDLTGTESISDRLMQPLQGSINEDRIGELWNPENGGLNRVVLAAEESIGLSDGLPRVVHILLGAAEWYATNAGLSLPGQHAEDDEESRARADDAEVTPDPNSDTMEVLSYGR